MAANNRSGAGPDMTEMWRQWYEMNTKAWSEALGKTREGYGDPYGIYSRWFNRMGNAHNVILDQLGQIGSGENKPGSRDPRQLWMRWFQTMGESWQKSAELGQDTFDLWPRWMQMMEQSRDNLLASGTGFPDDPLQFATHWYNATSGPFSDFIGDIVEREEFLEPASRLLESYASFYKVFRKNSEEYLHNLSLPVRSDIERIARLIVNLEEKVDGIEETLEDAERNRAASGASGVVKALEERIERLEQSVEKGFAKSMQQTSGDGAAAAEALETRLEEVESKLDRVLAALESGMNGADVASREQPSE